MPLLCAPTLNFRSRDYVEDLIRRFRKLIFNTTGLGAIARRLNWLKQISLNFHNHKTKLPSKNKKKLLTMELLINFYIRKNPQLFLSRHALAHAMKSITSNAIKNVVIARFFSIMSACSASHQCVCRLIFLQLKNLIKIKRKIPLSKMFIKINLSLKRVQHFIFKSVF